MRPSCRAKSLRQLGPFAVPTAAEEAADRYVVPDKFKNFPIYAWGFTIGPAITKLYSEWGVK